MPYGQYAGAPLASVPSQYLRYIYANHAFTRNRALQRCIEAYLQLPADPNIRPGSAAAQAFARGGTNGAVDGTKAAPTRGFVESRRPGPDTVYNAQRAPETGLEALRAVYERASTEALTRYQDDDDTYRAVSDSLARVRMALGI